MSRHLAPAIILAAILTPISAHAQVNIDQDKTPAHIFASDCSVCHKTTRGLANGRGNSALTGFLSEHYTSSREEAASVAAYVLSAGGGVGTATPVRGEQKPDSARGRPAAEAKPESKPEPKTRRAAREHGKPKEERSASVEPGTPATEKKPADQHRSAGPTRAHDQPKPEETAPSKPAPAAVTAAVKPAEPARPETTPVSPAASAPAQPQPAAASPAPTDNIPD